MDSTTFQNEEMLLVHPPAHPVPQLQGPFEESMIESVNDATDHETNMDSMERRTMLLEMPRYERVIAGRWKQKPGERFHPLWKITAQMSFGVHLLADGLARSEDEVMKILQAHVDDIDGFLERTTEDFDLAQSDVQERLRYLKLPLQHVEVFDRMLEDRSFRMSIVEGNEKIEHIVDRTSEAMKDSLKDVQKGLDATKTLADYLSELAITWIRTTAEHEAVFVAMVGNVEGWSQAFKDLYLQGISLGKSLVQLSEIVSEMQRRAGMVSRKMLIRPQSSSHAPAQSQQSKPGHNSVRRNEELRFSRQHPTARPESQKPLPTAPSARSSKHPSLRPDFPRQSVSTEKHAIIHDRGTSDSSAGRLVQTSHPNTPGSFGSGNQTTATSTIQHPVISELAGNGIAPRVRSMPLTELPAELPQRMRSQEHQPGSQRKSQNSPHLPSTPASTGSTGSGTVATKTGVQPSELDSGYFGFSGTGAQSADNRIPVLHSVVYHADEGLGIHGVTSISKPEDHSSFSPSQRLSTENPAFNSHPPSMMTVTKPVLPGNGSVQPVELACEVSPQRPASTQHSLQEANQSNMGRPITTREIDQIPEQNPMASRISPNDEAVSTVPPIQAETSQAQVISGSSSLSDIIARRSLTAKVAQDNNRLKSDKEPPVHGAIPNAAAETIFVAEMEGSSPPLLAPLTFSPVELEAPGPRLARPLRLAALTEPKREGGEQSSAAITSQSDFFKLPAIQTVGGLERIAKKLGKSRPGHGNLPVALPLSSENTASSRGENGKVPLKAPGFLIPRKKPLRLVGSDLIDRISDTPPDSPIHTRSLSESSMNSARLIGERPSRMLAPPAEAPPPPAPGGRSMVNPDYASAGAFEGERKSNRGSGGSGSSWRKIFSSLSSPLEPLGSRPGSSSLDRRPGSSMHSPDMMTAGGKDILWFKGMSRDGVWLSST